jgi:hypothetical protein
MTDGTGLDPATRELQELLHDFGDRWHVYQGVYDGAVCWEAEVRDLRQRARPVIRKATIPEMRAALEILDGRHR